ncbi:MAG: gamma-glutamyltransferase, partial [Gemmatimonadota bacterium]|nr:gamma-glutamyltransferase [Gemmatimonadota bacterium]
MQHHAHFAALAPSVLSMFSRLWVYVTLGATSIITEEAAPVLAGFAAHQHHLGVVQAVVACAIGSWAADIALYALSGCRWRSMRGSARSRVATRRIVGRQVARLSVDSLRTPNRVLGILSNVHHMRRSPNCLLLSLVAIAIGCSKPAQSSVAVSSTASSTAALPAAWPFARIDRSVSAAHGMVATDAPLATHVGAGVLRNGGNAVDAAVATAFALAVVFPGAGNVGGGGFLVAHMSDGREAALDFRETAPGSASRNMYLAANGHADDRSITGDLSAGVPGSVAGLWEAHKRFGSR